MHAVPICFGSPKFHEVELGPFRVTEAWFRPAFLVEAHHHDRPNLAMMLDGSFHLSFSRSRHANEIGPGTWFTEPAGDTHCNCVRCAGAHVLAIQPDPQHTELLDPFRDLLGAPRIGKDPTVIGLARRIALELRLGDPFAKLTAEGLLLELLARAGRVVAHSVDPEPAWLRRIGEWIASPPGPEPVRIEKLAREAGVHPAHLAKAYRSRYGRSLGSCLLERRLEWVSRELATSDAPIAALAIRGGFSDQSHLTRRFRGRFGLTPARYRMAAWRYAPKGARPGSPG